MINPYDNSIQSDYYIKPSIDYYDNELKRRDTFRIDTYNILIYEVSKDSMHYNHNLHLLTLTNMDIRMYTLLQLPDTRLFLDVLENSDIKSSTRFKITNVHLINEEDGLYNIQLSMISDYVFDMLNSNKYASISISDVNVQLTSFELISKIIQQMVSDHGTKVDANYTNAGELKNLLSYVRIPDNLNDFEIFNYLFDTYPPYLLAPYLIFDDFNIRQNSKSDFSIILLNICDINGSYPLKNIKSIPGTVTGYVEHLDSKPLLNYNEVFEELQATLIIKNENENKVFELKPAQTSRHSNKIKHINSSLTIESFKQKMIMRKILAEYEASIETYIYDDINLSDIIFGEVYNINNSLIYNYLPVSFFYKFIKKQDNSFKLETKIEFLRLPGSLITKGW